MLRTIEMELETGHFSFSVIQNAISNTGPIRAWYKDFGDTFDVERFREILFVLTDSAIVMADIHTPDYIEISNFQRKRIVQVNRSHSIHETDESIIVTLEQVTVFFDGGQTIEMLRPTNKNNALQFEEFMNILG